MDRTLVRRAVAVPVHAIGEDNNRFSLLNWSENVKRYLHRIVDSGSLTRASLFDGPAQDCSITGKVVQVPDLTVKRNDLNSIARAQLAQESDRRSLNLAQLLVRAVARVYHQHHIKWHVNRSQERDLLRYSVLSQPEFFFS